MFEDLISSTIVALAFAVLLVYLILASLYESFIIPLTIMTALLLALCGAFLALFLFHEAVNILSILGMVMLLGIASKNSILLVDFANQLVQKGLDRNKAILQAGKARLRPILMTSMALIAGTIPVAIGLNEASKQRTCMGIAIIGGVITSTLLTLVVVPAIYSYIDRLNSWVNTEFRNKFIK
jgi:hydrophobic/amphiphilic exporter-1 (mainly G- bacteria), HAE1 family